jgi:hypothetical protein
MPRPCANAATCWPISERLERIRHVTELAHSLNGTPVMSDALLMKSAWWNGRCRSPEHSTAFSRVPAGAIATLQSISATSR